MRVAYGWSDAGLNPAPSATIAVCEPTLNQSSDENYMYYATNYVDFT